MGAVWGWEKAYVSGDDMASMLIRCLTLLSARLSCIVHVRHLPRVSDWEARLVDRLSRKSTTTSFDEKLLANFRVSPPADFVDWLMNPTEDWVLPGKLCRFLDSVL